MGQPVVFGSYELLERIAEGGMAEVWRARSKGVAGFEKTVVIKRVLPALMVRPGFADLLIREAKIAARLSHPRIVQIFDLGEENGSYYIAMEYVHGRDLGQAMAYRGGGRTEGLSLPLRVWIVAEVASALDHAHRRKGDEGRPLQIVHRDVSPQNILLGYEGEVKVADFGIARADEAGLGRGEDPTILRGKYAYMSPEQARGEPLDRRSDLFSLGIVLYELLTGSRMFRGKSSHETLALVRAAEMPDLSAEALGIDPALSRVLSRCLAPARDDRYAWLSELYSELTQWLFQRGEPVGQHFLAEAMERMFPPDDGATPNKLRVNLLMRAHQDATAISLAGASLPVSSADESTDDAQPRTAAMPTKSRRSRVERRRVALLAAQREGPEEAFARAAEGSGGLVLTTQTRESDMRLAIFGHAAGVERGGALAARAALELRRALRAEAGVHPAVPSMVLLDGEARVIEGVAADVEPELIERARTLLEAADEGEIHVESQLTQELGVAFRLEAASSPRSMLLEGFRTRAERDAIALRQRAPLAGRREDLRVLSQAVIDTFEGKHRTIQVVGEAGAGKSRLLAELRAMVTPQDVHVISGRGDEADRDRPLAALADLIRDLCGVEAEDTPAERFAKVERLRVLNLTPREVRLCGELLGLAYPVRPEDRPGRPRAIEIVHALRKAIAALAHDRSVIVVIEDLQWLDDSTRQLVPLLFRGLSRPRVMVVLTRRPGTAVPHLPGEVLRLGPLPAEAAGKLFASTLSSLGARARMVEPELATEIVEQSGGNAAWIEMLAAEAHQAGALEVDQGVVRGIARLPTSIPALGRNLVAAWLAQLRPLERAMLSTAAACEPPVPVELLYAVEGLVGNTGHAHLAKLLAKRLVVPATDARDSIEDGPVGRWGGDDRVRLPERVALPGAMFRRAVLDALEPPELRRLHGRIVGTLERSTAGAGGVAIGSLGAAEAMRRLAHHASLSLDRRRAPEYLARSAETSIGEGHLADAARDLALASRILREEGDDPDGAVELALRAVSLSLDAGANDVAGEVLDELEQLYSGRGRPETRVAVATARAVYAQRVERIEAAIGALASVDDVIASAAPAARGAALLAQGRALLESGKVEEASDALRTAVGAYREANEIAGQGRALAVLAVAEARADRAQAADDAAEEALAVAARLGHAEVRYAALVAMGAAEEAAGDRHDAAARFHEAAEVAQHVGLDAELPDAALRAAIASLRAGDWAQAAQRAEQAVKHARKRKLERVSLLSAAIKAVLAIEEHPDSSYVPSIVRAIDRLEEMGRTAEAALAVELLSRAHAALGDADAAARARARAAETASRAGWKSMARALASKE